VRTHCVLQQQLNTYLSMAQQDEAEAQLLVRVACLGLELTLLTSLQLTLAGLPKEAILEQGSRACFCGAALAAVSTERDGVQVWRCDNSGRWTLAAQLPLPEVAGPPRLLAWMPAAEGRSPCLAVAAGALVWLVRLESRGPVVTSVLEHAERVRSLAWSPAAALATVSGGCVRLWARQMDSPAFINCGNISPATAC